MRALLLLFSLSLSACASFESGDLPYTREWPQASAAAPLAVSVEGLPEKFDAGWRRVITRTLRDSGRFAAVTAAADAQRVATLKIEVAHRRQPLWTSRIWMASCAFSLGVIPARAFHEFDVRAEVLDPRGRSLGVITRHVESSTWIGWVFVFAMPFAGVGMSGMVADTARSIVGEAANSGWL